MDRPDKEEILTRLRSFSSDVKSALDKLRDQGGAAGVIEAIEAVRWRATYLAERLLATTGRDYVHPEMANQLLNVVRLLDDTVASIDNAAISGPLASAAKALRAFVTQYEPKQTESGRFMFRIEGD